MPGIRENPGHFCVWTDAIRPLPYSRKTPDNFLSTIGFISTVGRDSEVLSRRRSLCGKADHMVKRTSCSLLASVVAFLLLVLAFQNLAAATDSLAWADPQSDTEALAGNAPQPQDTASLALHAAATLTANQVAQPEVIFLYSFPLPPGEPKFLGLKGTISLISQSAGFNESLNTIATNVSGPCPGNGTAFPNYTAVYEAYPNLVPLQSFILKTPTKGISKIDIDYTMPVGLPVSDCMVVMLDWEGYSSRCRHARRRRPPRRACWP